VRSRSGSCVPFRRQGGQRLWPGASSRRTQREGTSLCGGSRWSPTSSIGAISDNVGIRRHPLVCIRIRIEERCLAAVGTDPPSRSGRLQPVLQQDAEADHGVAVAGVGGSAETGLGAVQIRPSRRTAVPG
jgi:hypothetical protein